ncbi:MAG: type II toxin-antitoxin system Phd/YefM family antitoxin [Phyllobacteriaceae bacterium]|nr:type II toxin-antitoxin system Phd/YefM family antitoxin [Phyllobacteriaceae bacterium]
MKHFTATEAKNRFGELIDEVNNSPVVIRKNGRDVAVLLSKAEFDRRDTRLAKKELIQQYHEESIAEFEALYQELAK